MGVVKGLLALALVLNVVVVSNGGKSSLFVRKTNKNGDMPLDSDVFRVPPGYNAPQQERAYTRVQKNGVFFPVFELNQWQRLVCNKVHITQGDLVGRAMIISWVTMDEPGSGAVRYWSEKNGTKKIAKGKMVTYRFFNYSSGFIHHTTIRKLKYNTKYYYEVGHRNTTRQFSFITPPQIGPDVPYTFGLIGDVGQSFDSNTTLSHYELSPKKEKQYCLLEISLMLISTRIMIMLGGILGEGLQKGVLHINHGYGLQGTTKLILFGLGFTGETVPFKPFSHRYHVPYEVSQSTSPFWYSIKRASAHIIVLSSYSAYGRGTPQYTWLEKELPKVKRSETPWLIVLMHSPLYNSYNNHFMEGEAMRTKFEAWFVKYKVDVVFPGHVHACKC
ncbi:hypothetical protein ACSQ67_021958 [Phaseolus vulgaris]